MIRVGQNPLHTVHVQYFWQENHQIYGYIQSIYTNLANIIMIELIQSCL